LAEAAAGVDADLPTPGSLAATLIDIECCGPLKSSFFFSESMLFWDSAVRISIPARRQLSRAESPTFSHASFARFPDRGRHNLEEKPKSLKRHETTKEIFGVIWSKSPTRPICRARNRFQIKGLCILRLNGAITEPASWSATV
jgi:hypothetical protein